MYFYFCDNTACTQLGHSGKRLCNSSSTLPRGTRTHLSDPLHTVPSSPCQVHLQLWGFQHAPRLQHSQGQEGVQGTVCLKRFREPLTLLALGSASPQNTRVPGGGAGPGKASHARGRPLRPRHTAAHRPLARVQDRNCRARPAADCVEGRAASARTPAQPAVSATTATPSVPAHSGRGQGHTDQGEPGSLVPALAQQGGSPLIPIPVLCAREHLLFIPK